MPQSPAPQTTAEKRRQERIRLYSPLLAFLGGERVTLVDASPLGVRIEHSAALPIGGRIDISLRHEGTDLSLSGTVVRCRLDRSIVRDAIIYDMGIDFTDAAADQRSSLREMIVKVSNLDIDARRKYARKRKRQA